MSRIAANSSRGRYGNAHGRGKAQAVSGTGWNADRDPQSATDCCCPQVTDIIVATRADEMARLKELIAREKFKQPVRVVKGGDSRQDSVGAALREVPTARKSCWCMTRAAVRDAGAGSRG